MEWSPLPLRMGLSLRSHSKGHGRIPHFIQEEMVNLHFHSKESSELASFLLSEVETSQAPGFRVQDLGFMFSHEERRLKVGTECHFQYKGK